MGHEGIVLFDGVCNLCNWLVQFLLKHDKRAVFTFASLQSTPGKRLSEEHSIDRGSIDSFVYIKNGRAYERSTAMIQVALSLRRQYALSAIFYVVPRPIRDAVYNFIAKRRYTWFGKRDQCMVPTPEIQKRFLDS